MQQQANVAGRINTFYFLIGIFSLFLTFFPFVIIKKSVWEPQQSTHSTGDNMDCLFSNLQERREDD